MFCTKLKTASFDPTRNALDCVDGFALFFTDKIHRIKETIESRLGSTLGDPLRFDPHLDGLMLVDLSPLSNDEICKLIVSMSAKSSPMDKQYLRHKNMSGCYCSFDL